MAAHLVLGGFTGAEDVFEHAPGFLHAFSYGGRIDLERPVRTGINWHITSDNRISIKKYPICYCTHRCIDGVFDLLAKTPIKAEDVERIDAAAVAKGKGDGYSILFGSATVITVAPALHQNLAYDPMKELVPVIEFAYAPQVLSAHPSFPVKSVKDVVQLAKAKPGEVLYSNAGIGSAGHMAMALFESVTQIRLNNISYTGAGPALAALVGGHVNIIFNLLNTTLPQYHAGKINSLGVSSLKRTDLLPKVPTIAESGYPGFETGVWYGLFVPTGTPQPVIRQINKDMLQLMQTPKMQEALVTTGFAAVGSTPEQFRAKVRAELDTWRKLVKENNIKGE